jgi:hypothetical protein
MNFWKDSKQSRVTWHPDDDRLAAVIATSRFRGLYALVAGDRVLKVGLAGIVYRGQVVGTVGERLDHHLRTISRSSHPAWWEFTDTLRGRDLTVYTLPYDPPGVDPNEACRLRREREGEAMRQAPGGRVLWEDMRFERRDQPVTPGKKNPRVLVEPDAVRRRVIAELGPSAA